MFDFLFSRTTVQFLQYYVTPYIQPPIVVAMNYFTFQFTNKSVNFAMNFTNL